MKKIIYISLKILIMLTTLSGNINALSPDRKEQLKEIIKLNADKVFLNRPVQDWPKDKSKINLWDGTLDEVYYYVKKSGSKELPVIFDKYLRPVRNPNTSLSWTLKNDLSTDIISQIAIANSLMGEKKKSKFEEIAREFASVLKDVSAEIHKITTWRQATGDAKDILLYLTDTIFSEIYKKLEKNINPETKFTLKPKKTVQDLPIGAIQEIAKKSIEESYAKLNKNKQITEKEFFKVTDNMYSVGGKTKQAVEQFASTEGLKKELKNYNYYRFKIDTMDEIIKQKTNNSTDPWDQIKIAAQLEAANWFVGKHSLIEEDNLLNEAIKSENLEKLKELAKLGMKEKVTKYINDQTAKLSTDLQRLDKEIDSKKVAMQNALYDKQSYISSRLELAQYHYKYNELSNERDWLSSNYNKLYDKKNELMKLLEEISN